MANDYEHLKAALLMNDYATAELLDAVEAALDSGVPEEEIDDLLDAKTKEFIDG